MATILKCKMCGGDIEVSQDMTVGTCLYCGSTMTLPRIDSEKKARLFNRANEYRLHNEFDKAFDAYKTIVDEDEQEAEAYWGMLLSEFGVEYVEDPKTKKRIPTCHRTHVYSVQSTANYDMACKYADSENKFMYQDEAEELDRIQKSIISISSKEDPYDVFICYKETVDDSEERTTDSVLAQEIYEELTKQGLKAFFSRITLAEKLGKDYEPYIYAALNSAKVMIVVCTSNQNANSVWVKNEWSRYLHFMQEDSSKSIIPVFRDMTAYELPDELKRFQSQDMSKMGALQDVVTSVKKLVTAEARAEKDSALETLIQQRIKKERRKSEIKDRVTAVKRSLVSNMKYLIITAIAIVMIVAGIIIYKSVIVPNRIYMQGISQIESGAYDEAINTFNSLGEYKDSTEYSLEATYLKAVALIESEEYDNAISVLMLIRDYKNSENMITEANYLKAKALVEDGQFETALSILEEIGDYSGSEELIEECKKGLLLKEYNSIVGRFENSKKSLNSYDEAISSLESLRNKGLQEAIDKTTELYTELVKESISYTKSGDNKTAKLYLDYLSEHNDVVDETKLGEAYDSMWAPIYDEAVKAFDENRLGTARAFFSTIPDDYRDVKTKKTDCNQAIVVLQNKYKGTWIKNDGSVKLVISGSSNAKYIPIPLTSSFNLDTTYDVDTDYFTFKEYKYEYAISVSGNTLTVKSISNSSGSFVGTYRKQE